MLRRPAIALVLLITACTEVSSLRTLPREGAVRWVPDERARLGHVRDDALGDIGAEIARLRAIASFEIAGEDPDHQGLRSLLRLHEIDLRLATTEIERAAARERITTSHTLFIDALPLAGRTAFAAILTHAPELLVSRPDEVLRFLRSAHPIGGERCAIVAPRGFFVDVVSRELACRSRYAAQLESIFPRLRSDVRAWLRIRGLTHERDGISASDARILAEQSFFGTRGLMYAALQRGNVDEAALLASEIRTRDVHDVGAALALALAGEIAEETFPRDPFLVGLLTIPYGPAHVAHLAPRSQVAKVALLETLSYAGLPDDYDAVRSTIAARYLEALGPVLAYLDAHAHPTPGTSASLSAETSLATRAYAVESLDRFGWRDAYPPTAESLLTLETPAFLPVSYGSSRSLEANRSRLLARIDVPVLRARLRRELECDGQWNRFSATCSDHALDPRALDAIDLDASTLRALAHTRVWRAPALFELFDRFEGTPVSAREEYVALRVRALVFSGEHRQAARRLITDGRVLDRATRLSMTVAMADADAGRTPVEAASPQSLLDLLRNALARGCSESRRSSRTDDEPIHLGRALAAAFAPYAPSLDSERLEALSRHLEGEPARELAAYLAFAALERRDRAGFEAAFERAALSHDSLLAKGLTVLAQRVFDGETELAADVAWFDAYLDDSTHPPDDEYLPQRPRAQRAPEADPDALEGRLAQAYFAFADSRDPRDLERFLAMPPSNENARRVQCSAAVAAFPWSATPYAEFRVPHTSRIRKALEVVASKCVLETPTAERTESALHLLRSFSVDPSPIIRDAIAALPPALPWHHPGVDRDPLELARVAVAPANRNYVLLRLLGMSRPLTYALEGRSEPARQAALGDEESEGMHRALTDDLDRGHLDENAALAAIAVLLPTGRRYHDDGRERVPILETLREAHPSSRTLVWLAASAPRIPGADDRSFFVRHAEAFLRIANDDAPLLRLLADTFRVRHLDRAARRASERAAALDPGYRERATDADCAPP